MYIYTSFKYFLIFQLQSTSHITLVLGTRHRGRHLYTLQSDQSGFHPTPDIVIRILLSIFPTGMPVFLKQW